ncbi:hypothetical protein [Janthinobacterium sp. LB3P112]|uniref:hypothetical protein n=1 Tax=Janthinobacterium sp. LB3P112 TaxID=3424196 RepID=UPI003F228381
MDSLGGKMAPSYTCTRFKTNGARLAAGAVVYVNVLLMHEQGDQYDDGQWNAQQQQEDGTHGNLLD